MLRSVDIGDFSAICDALRTALRDNNVDTVLNACAAPCPYCDSGRKQSILGGVAECSDCDGTGLLLACVAIGSHLDEQDFGRRVRMALRWSVNVARVPEHGMRIANISRWLPGPNVSRCGICRWLSTWDCEHPQNATEPHPTHSAQIHIDARRIAHGERWHEILWRDLMQPPGYEGLARNEDCQDIIEWGCHPARVRVFPDGLVQTGQTPPLFPTVTLEREHE